MVTYSPSFLSCDDTVPPNKKFCQKRKFKDVAVNVVDKSAQTVASVKMDKCNGLLFNKVAYAKVCLWIN